MRGLLDLPSRIWRYAASDGVPRRSCIVALIVGTILNLINRVTRYSLERWSTLPSCC